MFMVFATAPLGLVGAVPTLLIFHQPFGFNAILGLIGLAGSIIGYQTIGLTTLAHRLGAPTRLVSIVAGSVCGAALFFGASLFSYIPKVVLGGMLVYLGLTFLVEWLIDSRRVLPLADYLLIWVILGIILSVGFLPAIAVGILVAAVLFVISYSRE
jgi:SulP family sulfate permease